MAKPGPKPTPTATLERRGSWRAKARAGEPTPEALAAPPPPPKGVTGEAARHWREMAPRMVGAGTLTTVDLPAFARYCRTLALWEKMMGRLERAKVIERADVLAWDKVTETLRKLDAAFGQTPADRADLKLPEKEANADPFQKPKISAA
jgi:phage terminase small subunit